MHEFARGVIFCGSLLRQFSQFNVRYQNFIYHVFKVDFYNRLWSDIGSCTYMLRA